MIYNVTDEETMQEDFQLLADGFRLLQYDYLGGHGSRGYGRIQISDLETCCVIGDIADELLEQCSKIIGMVTNEL